MSGAPPPLPAARDASGVCELTRVLRAGDAAKFFALCHELHAKAKAQRQIKDRRYQLKSYKRCIKGDEFVTWLVTQKYAKHRVEAEIIGINLVAAGVGAERTGGAVSCWSRGLPRLFRCSRAASCNH